MELLHWRGEKKWALPSIDIDSLELLAYVKFSSANVEVKPTFKSLVQKEGRTLPCLCLPEDEVVYGNQEIIRHLNLKHFDANTWLDDGSKNYSLVLKAIIEERLKPAVQATLWMEVENYSEIVRPVFARNCRYPINFTEAKKMHDRIEEHVSVSKHLLEDEDATKMKKLMAEGAEAIQTLSQFLKNQDFIFGARPCSVDALLFSCLAPLVKIPLKSGELHNEVRKTENLVQYVDRILMKYLREIEREEKDDTNEEKTQKEESSAKKSSKSEDEENKYDWLFSVGIATAAMVSYAIHVGLIQIRRTAAS